MVTIIGYPRRKTHYKNNTCFFLSLLFFILFFSSPLHADEPMETVTIQLKWFHQFQFAGYYAAIEKGFYAEEGLDVLLKEHDPSKSSTQAVIDKDANYGIADASLLLQRMRGNPVILLKQIFQHSPLIFISPGNSDIISPYEMIGKKVMFDPNEEIALQALFLDTIGITGKIWQVPHSYDYDDLIKGKVDVLATYLTDAPYIFRQRGFQINIINPQNYGIDFYGDNLFTTEYEVKTHPERVDKMISASIKGWEYALDHPQEIIDLIKTKYGSKLSREQLKFEAKMTELMIIPELIPVGNINPKRYERIAEIYKRLSIANGHKVPEGFIYQKETSPLSYLLTAEERAWLKDHSEIKFGVPSKVEPYLIINPNGTYSGVIIDLFDALNNKLGTDIGIEAGPWAEIVEKAETFEIDGLIGLKSENADRLGLLKSKSFYSIYPVIYIKDDVSFKGLDDLKDKVVVIREGSYYAEEILKPYMDTAKIIRVADNLKAMQMLFENKADVMIGLSSDNYLILKYHLNGLVPSSILWRYPLRPVIGVRSDWPELINILNKGINSFTENELNGLVSKWYNMPLGPSGLKLTSFEKTFLLEHPLLRVAIEPHWTPIEYVDESGNSNGISVDFLDKIGSALDLSFEFVRGDTWQDLLDIADRGEVDLFPSMALTAQREDKFKFTKPYVSYPIVIFGKKETPYIGDLKELYNKKVAVIKGYAIDEWLSRDHPKIELIKTKSIHEAIEALLSDKADACIGNILTISNQISSQGYSHLINVVGETPYSYDLCFAVSKKLAPLVPIIQKVLDSITDLEKNEIQRKWLSIGYEHGFDYSWIWKGVIAVVITLILILLWNRHLASEVKKRTQALELNKRIVSNSSIGTVAFRASGECIMANEAAATLIGGTIDGMLKQNFREIKSWQETGLLNLAEKALETEKVQDSEIKTTSPFGKEVSLHCRLVPFWFKKKKHLLLMYEDISERKQAEKALKENEQKYRTLFNSASDAIFLMEGNLFIDCNDKTLEIFGCTRDQIIGQSPYRFSPALQPDGRDSKESAAEKINAVMQGNHQFFEWQHCRYDNSLFYAEVSLVLVEVSGKKYSLAIVRDITERKRAETAEAEKDRLSGLLQQAQKMEAIGTLAGGIAHDFNNILSSVFGYTELAKMGIAKGENIEKELEEVLNAAMRAKSLVKHILTFSRQASIQKSPIAIYPLIKETLKFIRSSIPATIEINHDLGDSDLMVLADSTQIHQILMNLCTNAAHAMKDKGGILDVRLEEVEIVDETTLQYKYLKRGKYIRLSVGDTGTGIEKTVIEKIFDPFFTTKERGEGTGLGLSVIHGIVKDMEGAISVYSEPGTGTTFQVLLPECEGEAKDTIPEEATIIKGKGIILFVDDEKPIIDSGKRILRGLGYDVISTTSSIEALKIFKAQPDSFDLVLTDMTMPKMTGLEFSREVLKIRPGIPIILCTGYSLGLTEPMIRKTGIRKMVMKPMISSELAAAINEVLNC